RLCDMGVDAIIGGHPHVVQPVDVFTSSDGNHKMFCAFSLGNQLSNQRREMMNLSTGHTEDGLVVNLEITKKEDGEVSLTGAEYIPTWVYKNSAGPTYYIIPLDNLDTVEADTGISGLKSKGQASYDRTYDIIGSGIQKVKDSYGF
ncbi:MAG: CapA family protein, partial [Anaerovoracaceae bacterium]